MSKKSEPGSEVMWRLLSFLVLLGPLVASAQDVRLDNCRELPIVKARVGNHQFQFLLDTGASITLLNRKSFSSTERKEILMESWNGATGAPANEVTLEEFRIGERSLFNLKLLAVDLTSVERSCEKRVDGVLGADLISKLGLTIDLKNHLASVEADPKNPEARFSQLDAQHAACEDAFNRSDEKAFEQCLDPDVVLLTPEGAFRGRDAVMQHFREIAFGCNPRMVVSMTPRGRHAIGNVILVEYDMSVTVGDQVKKTHTTALYQKSGQHWLMSNMNYSAVEPSK